MIGFDPSSNRKCFSAIADRYGSLLFMSFGSDVLWSVEVRSCRLQDAYVFQGTIFIKSLPILALGCKTLVDLISCFLNLVL